MHKNISMPQPLDFKNFKEPGSCRMKKKLPEHDLCIRRSLMGKEFSPHGR
jgi:hypothetical protein